jgi:hypothetical protein
MWTTIVDGIGSDTAATAMPAARLLSQQLIDASALAGYR